MKPSIFLGALILVAAAAFTASAGPEEKVVGPVAAEPAPAEEAEEEPFEESESSVSRNFAGSVQLDYLAIVTEDVGRDISLDGATVELSLKLAMDFGEHVSSNVKICFACHGLEVGMAYFDLRVSDGLNFRLGRFTPSFGEFPQRHDPANHLTSDKPLPYDMGRMVRLREWNMSVLPAPWVDNGMEVNGTQFFGDSSQVDYAVYAVGGPRAGAEAIDFDYIQSRSPQLYYVDNNSMPSVGARFAMSLGFGESNSVLAGLSGMGGTYDPDNELTFLMLGADLGFRFGDIVLRGEYLIRRTEFALGDSPETKFRYGPGLAPDGSPGTQYDDFFLKDGFYAELIVPAGPIDLIGRWDGMRRMGNVVATSPLRSRSTVLRYTAGFAAKLQRNLRLKVSVEQYDFSDFEDETALHVGIAGPF